MSIYRTRNATSINTIKNSLSDILPSKSQNSLERAKFEQSQQASIVKAINNTECPVKEKHIRNIILGTCYEKSATPFWYNSVKLQLHGNPVLCWKFCYVLHKLLRDGFSSTAEDSFQFVPTLDDLAKSWVHLKQGYGTMLFHYLNYLMFKIKFHKKNQFIPCNLLIEDKDLVEVAANNIDNYFQLCCEFFDYADEIIGLQNTVFMTMDRGRSNSMTDSGQCKLAPLVLCIQESNQLYDFCVKFLFKLHDNLPSEILEGHRERFLNIFKELGKFYECSRNLQYFKNLISIPELPGTPPNFRQKSEFTSYSKPIVTVVEEPTPSVESIQEEADSLLVDVGEAQQQQHQDSLNNSSSSNNELQQVQFQQYMYTQNLLQEIERLRAQLESLASESAIEITSLKEVNKDLNDQLYQFQTELEQQKIKTSCLEDKIKIANENEKAKTDLDNLEKKAVSSEEKFNKMKELYTKLKDQHVVLLRQEADVRKQKLTLAENCEHSSKIQKDLQTRLDEAMNDKVKSDEALQEKLNDFQSYKSENEKSQAENINLNQNYQEQIKSLKDKLSSVEFDLSEALEKTTALESKSSKLEEECSSNSRNADTLSTELDQSKASLKELNSKFENLTSEKQSAEATHKTNQTKLCLDFYTSTVETCVHVVKDSLHLFADPVLLNCKSGAEYLLYKLEPFTKNINDLNSNYKLVIKSDKVDDMSDYLRLLKLLNSYTLLTSDCVIFGKITSLTAADFEQGKELAELSENFGKKSLELLEQMQHKDEINDSQIESISNIMSQITAKLTDLLPKVHNINKEELGDLVDQEMYRTSKAIEDAVSKLEHLISKSREQETGIKLEVNDKILDSCTSLMKAIKILIIRGKELQKEIVSQGRGTSSVKEFYAKNRKWTEGLVSAAKQVGSGANYLIEKADKIVNGDGTMEEIIVCSNEIAASTAQLVVSSNVLANRESQNRIDLIHAKNEVSTATADLVAAAKSCSQIIDDKTSMDFSKITPHQTKLLEMEAQVAVIHLEKQLENEKKKLYELRKKHYKEDTDKN